VWTCHTLIILSFTSDINPLPQCNIAASKAKIFTVLDALKGYHQCPLDQDSQILTTFITPFSSYKYLRAPYGISSISEHYNRCMTEAFRDLTRFRHIVDDFVIYDNNITDHVSHVQQSLQRCADNNITLNIDKCQFFKSQVTFAGFQLLSKGYKIDPSITEAITNYPTPTNQSDLCCLIGLVNQLSTSTNTLTTLLAPLRPLLSTKNEFLWSSFHQEVFTQVKASFTTLPLLLFFDITKPTRLSRCQQTGTRICFTAKNSRYMDPYPSWFSISIRCRDSLNLKCLLSHGLSQNVGYFWLACSTFT